MKKKPNWETLNFDNISDWCQEFLCYSFVEDDLSDVGVHCKEIEDRINIILIMLKKELDKMELVDDD